MNELALRKLYYNEPLDDIDPKSISAELFNYLAIHNEFERFKKLFLFMKSHNLEFRAEEMIVSNRGMYSREMISAILHDDYFVKIHLIIYLVNHTRDDVLLEYFISKHGPSKIFNAAKHKHEWVANRILDTRPLSDLEDATISATQLMPSILKKLIEFGYSFGRIHYECVLNSNDANLIFSALDNGMNIIEHGYELFEKAIITDNKDLYDLLTAHGLKINEYANMHEIKSITFLELMRNNGYDICHMDLCDILITAIEKKNNEMIDLLIDEQFNLTDYVFIECIRHGNLEMFKRLRLKKTRHNIINFARYCMIKNNHEILEYLMKTYSDEPFWASWLQQKNIPFVKPECLKLIIDRIDSKNIGIIYSDECVRILLSRGFRMAWIDEYKFVSHLGSNYKTNDPKIKKILSWINSFGQRLIRSKELSDIHIL